jgi:ABC-type sugar transport system ATPase subunit
MQAICKAFPGVLALDHVEITARPGRVTALVGANGAGKSTLMNILGGIVSRDSGEIVIAGQPVALRTPIESLQAGISFVQQELNSLPTMSISENIFIDAFPQWFGRIDTRNAFAAPGSFFSVSAPTLIPRRPSAISVSAIVNWWKSRGPFGETRSF